MKDNLWVALGSELADDLSNLHLIPFPALQRALLGHRSSAIWQKLEETALRLGQYGSGVEEDRLPPPYQQQGEECATLLLLNGVQAVLGPEYSASSRRTV